MDFPGKGYGSPNFLKWIEPPLVNTKIGATNRYGDTQADLETPGFALKFFSYAPLMAGANWCITAEQILRDEGGDVATWKIQAPYDWDGTWTNPNDVELAWHIYLAGLDSGFNYYGGLGNDDEAKPALATKNAINKLQAFMSSRMHKDATGPTVLKRASPTIRAATPSAGTTMCPAATRVISRKCPPNSMFGPTPTTCPASPTAKSSSWFAWTTMA